MPAIITDEDSNYLIQNINLARKMDSIPAQVYIPVMSEEGPRLIKGRANYVIPKNPLGDHKLIRDLVVADYSSAKRPVGLILVGLKGSGKTMLSEDICNQVLKMGRPVLHVTSPLPGEILSAIIDLLGPCVVVFDEFGKVYRKEEMRNTVLTLFSDSETRNVLFIVTSNHENEFLDAMMNRPGRFKYRINYDGIKSQTIVDAVTVAGHTPALLDYVSLYSSYHKLSYDMLLLIKEILTKCKTVADFTKQLAFYNVPRRINLRYAVKSVTYAGSTSDYAGYLTADEEGAMELEISHKVTGEVVIVEKFDWAKVDKEKREELWLIKFDETFKVGIRREVSEHTLKPRARNSSKNQQAGFGGGHQFDRLDEGVEYNSTGDNSYRQPVVSF